MPRPPLACAFTLLALVTLSGCGDDLPTNRCDAARCLDAAHDAPATDGRPPPPDVAPPRTIAMLTIDPPIATLRTSIGTPVSQTFHVRAHFSDGTDGTVDGSWSLDSPLLGDIDPVSGVFNANGVRGGVARVQFRTTAAGGGAADAQVVVDLEQTIAPAMGMPGADAAMRFAMAGAPQMDPAARANVLYPLDGVLFPQNITAPRVQWERGNAGDLYRVRYVKPHITVVQYVAHTGMGFTFSAALPDDVFSRVAESDPDSPATLVVDRLDAAASRVIAGDPLTLRFATGSVSGIVYYWSMQEGRLHRIPAGTVNNQTLFPSGIRGTPDSTPSYTYSSCIACHQISRDGRYLLANGDSSYVFDLSTVDPTGAMVPVRVRAGYRWYFSTMSPDNSRIFATMGDATLSYVDAMLNPVTPMGTMPPTANVAHPYWSPDGRSIALITNVAGWTTNAAFSGGDLTVIPVTGRDTFGAAQVIHRGASLAMSDPAGGNTDCFPSWTPDSRYLVFAHTVNTRAATGDGRTLGSLYMISPTVMGATPVRLVHASDEGSEPRAHYPNLSPFTSGGYYWIVFYSDRDYGNAQAGTRGTRRPQLWVSAISTTFDGSHDPSQVPYWLPGQDVGAQNADAVWAAAACRMTGDSCRTSSDCCSGACSRGSDGMFRCTPPPSCRREGESCERDADCCGMGTLTCDPVIRTCQRPLG